MTQLGDLIRQRRHAGRWSLADLAEAADCSKAYLSAMENHRLDNPPRRAVLQRLEQALGLESGDLVRLADWQRTPEPVRTQVRRMAQRSRDIAALLGKADTGRDGIGRDLDALYASGRLQDLLDEEMSDIRRLGLVSARVPLINHVAAGYPTEFTDLDYPASVADEYISVPGISDPQAFAARVCGPSMEPDYQEGDIIVFSPNRTPSDGDDCFFRLLPDHHTTFKRLHIEPDDQVRLQPLNPRFEPQTVSREDLSGMYPAVYRMQRLGAG